MGDRLDAISSIDTSEPQRGSGQLVVSTVRWAGLELSKEVLGLDMFTSESTLTQVLSDSQFDKELSSRTVHNAEVMLSCRSIDPLLGSDL